MPLRQHSASVVSQWQHADGEGDIASCGPAAALCAGGGKLEASSSPLASCPHSEATDLSGGICGGPDEHDALGTRADNCRSHSALGQWRGDSAGLIDREDLLDDCELVALPDSADSGDNFCH